MGKQPGSKFDRYLDGRRHRVKLENYANHKDLESLRNSVLVVAKYRGLKIRTKIDREKNVVIVQVVSDEEAA